MKFNLGYLVVTEHGTAKKTGKKILNKPGIPLIFKYEYKSSDKDLSGVH